VADESVLPLEHIGELAAKGLELGDGMFSEALTATR
jgi:hypothetical protein